MVNYKEFEDKELELFMDKFFPYANARLFLINLLETEFHEVRKETKIGIEKAVDDYLKAQNPVPETLYHADLLDFYHENAVRPEVKKRIQDLNPLLTDVDLYSEEIAAAYRSFVFNESSNRFKEEFSAK